MVDETEAGKVWNCKVRLSEKAKYVRTSENRITRKAEYLRVSKKELEEKLSVSQWQKKELEEKLKKLKIEFMISRKYSGNNKEYKIKLAETEKEDVV